MPQKETTHETPNEKKFHEEFFCTEEAANSSPQQISRMLAAWGQGDKSVEEKLIPLVYQDLRRLAGSIFAQERREHTLQPTALVNEAYLRLRRQNEVRWKNRAQFFAIAARIMRRILVDHARKKQSVRHGGDRTRISIDSLGHFAVDCPIEVMHLEEALKELEKIDPLKASITELRFFAGFTEPEAAEFLQCSTATVTRHWRMAKAWLYRALSTQA